MLLPQGRELFLKLIKTATGGGRGGGGWSGETQLYWKSGN